MLSRAGCRVVYGGYGAVVIVMVVRAVNKMMVTLAVCANWEAMCLRAVIALCLNVRVNPRRWHELKKISRHAENALTIGCRRRHCHCGGTAEQHEGGRHSALSCSTMINGALRFVHRRAREDDMITLNYEC